MCFGSEEGAGGAAARGVGRVGGGGAVLHGLPHAVADGVEELLDAVGARAGGDVGHVVRLGPRLGGLVVDGGGGGVVALVADQEVCDVAVAAVALGLGDPLLADVQRFLGGGGFGCKQSAEGKESRGGGERVDRGDMESRRGLCGKRRGRSR